ncbi:MAG: recombinase family protein [Chloroflexi bacterium]|nr:recombinase family protein [Chloroflexota bacterium]
MSSQHPATSITKIALCYIRLSYTREGDDRNSPDRQRANIERVLAEKEDWQAEWYEDVGGHKSGRDEESRPQWLALKSRLDDADVVAVIANDMSRLHRKNWRMGRLIDTLEHKGIALILAAPGRHQLDTSTHQGRMLAQFIAMVDESYAEDIAQRSRESIAYRKRKGITIGIPPFATVRDTDGHLILTTEGAWYMPDGTFQKGTEDDPPHADAIWRPYARTAEYMLELYATGQLGMAKVAYQLNEEGWPVRDRYGTPRLVTGDDVRRITSNWPAYGGMIVDKRAKDRPGYQDVDLDNIPFVPKHAVFPTELLETVAKVRQQRSMDATDGGIRMKATPYPLSRITYCARCEKIAEKHKNPKLRTRLHGYNGDGRTRRYRHKSGQSCGTRTRTVHCTQLEELVGRLISLLEVDPVKVEVMTQMALEVNEALGIETDTEDLEEKKQKMINMYRRKIKAAATLYGDLHISKEEYKERTERFNREIVSWQNKTTQAEKIQIELNSCLAIIQQMATLWESSSPKEKKGMAEKLFEKVIYDLDTGEITDFRLKPWADRFLVLRSHLVAGEDVPAAEQQKIALQSLQSDVLAVPPTGAISNIYLLPLTASSTLQTLSNTRNVLLWRSC